MGGKLQLMVSMLEVGEQGQLLDLLQFFECNNEGIQSIASKPTAQANPKTRVNPQTREFAQAAVHSAQQQESPAVGHFAHERMDWWLFAPSPHPPKKNKKERGKQKKKENILHKVVTKQTQVSPTRPRPARHGIEKRVLHFI